MQNALAPSFSFLSTNGLKVTGATWGALNSEQRARGENGNISGRARPGRRKLDFRTAGGGGQRTSRKGARRPHGERIESMLRGGGAWPRKSFKMTPAPATTANTKARAE